MIEKTCEICDKVFKVKPYLVSKRKHCSEECCWKSKKGKSFFAGKKHSEETKKRWSILRKGRPSPNKGKKASEETKKKQSIAQKGKHAGEKHPQWKGGIRTNGGGYVFIHNPTHPFCIKQGYVRRSHLVMEKYLGRYLTKKEQIHHKGIKYSLGSVENKQDDRLENLMLFSNASTHTKYHWFLKSYANGLLSDK